MVNPRIPDHSSSKSSGAAGTFLACCWAPAPAPWDAFQPPPVPLVGHAARWASATGADRAPEPGAERRLGEEGAVPVGAGDVKRSGSTAGRYLKQDKCQM